MKKNKIKSVVIFMVSIIVLCSCNNIETVKIGDQEWMKKNLSVTKFRNGDPIPKAETIEEWLKAIEIHQPAWCYYNNDPQNGEKFGLLYNYFAVVDTRGIAPKGWRIPEEFDWKNLIANAGGDEVCTLKLMSKEEWIGIQGNNLTGFNALPGGERNPDNFEFKKLGNYTAWWCTDIKNGYATMCSINNEFRGISLRIADLNYSSGRYIRCVKE